MICFFLLSSVCKVDVEEVRIVFVLVESLFLHVLSICWECSHFGCFFNLPFSCYFFSDLAYTNFRRLSSIFNSHTSSFQTSQTGSMMSLIFQSFLLMNKNRRLGWWKLIIWDLAGKSISGLKGIVEAKRCWFRHPFVSFFKIFTLSLLVFSVCFSMECLK